MRHTLSEIRTLVKQFVDSGSCRNSVIDARVNEALERLMDGHDWECLRRVIRLNVLTRTVVLPPSVEKILWVDTDGVPGKLFGQAYQFLSSGVGDLDYRTHTTGSGYKDVVDLGDHWSIMYDIPSSLGNLPLIALSNSAVDAAASVSVYGRDADQRTVSDTLTVQEIPAEVTLGWTGAWTGDLADLTLGDESFTYIDRVVKPVTTGTISLLAVDVEHKLYYKLAIYYPATTLPQFRRYRLTNFHPDTTVTTDDETSCGSTDVLALVRLRFTPLVAEDDEVPIDSIQAVKFMVIAIREENAGNLQGALNYEEKAVSVLTDREKTRTMTDGTPVIINHDYRASMGQRMNRRGLIL